MRRVAERIRVEVVFALPERAVRRVVDLAPGSTAREAVVASGIDQALQGMDVACMPLGCFGRRCEDATPLSDGDRVEIYRPLRVDPKQARRERRKR